MGKATNLHLAYGTMPGIPIELISPFPSPPDIFLFLLGKYRLPVTSSVPFSMSRNSFFIIITFYDIDIAT